MHQSLELISYLRSFGIEPSCFASSLNTNEKRYGIDHPLNYTIEETNVYYFHSEFVPSTLQWWLVDLHTFIRLKSYQLLSGQICNWVNTWTFEISLNNQTWKRVHSHEGFSDNAIINFPQNEVAQYIRITGNDEGCGQYVGALAFQRLYLYGYPLYFYSCEVRFQIPFKRILFSLYLYLS